MRQPDFAMLAHHRVASRAELATLLRDSKEPALRLCGSASSLERVPAPPQPVHLVSTAALDQIERLEAADLTCSVQPGVTRAHLDAELAQHRLVLPCPGEGTIGGIFARGEYQPLAPGALAARNLVLGLEGVLVDGTMFKVGARVVKSVAGYDLHRAFVGSRGRLFAATLLHLKLRPAPPAQVCFAQTFDAIEPALARFRELRALPAAPSVLALRRERHGELSVWGVFEGARAQVDTVCNALRLTKIEETPSLHLTRDKEEELVDGVVPPSALPKLLAAMPVGTPWQVFGTGQVHVVGTPAASDACLSTLAMLAGCGEIRLGAPARRGKSTPLDPGAAQLERDLRHALDPESRLQ